MVKNKITIGILLLVMLVGVALIPAVSAQEEKDYSVTAEEALKHANANMIHFIATNPQGFENWTGASIDSKPVELYDINGQKLFYQFSVYKNTNLIGRIDIGANKTLGQSVRLVETDPIPFKVAEAMNKSIEIAKNESPDGKIKSTTIVVYAYPEIGAMTVVKDKTTGVEHRIFVDAYTLEKVEDKPATETEPGVLSMYEKISKKEIDENLKKWQNSDELTKSIEQEANNNGININLPVTEENIKKLSGNTTIASTTVQKAIAIPAYFAETILTVPTYTQATTYYCQPASAQMLTKYYNDVRPTQNVIYAMMNGVAPNGVTDTNALLYYKSSSGMNKPNSVKTTTVIYWDTVVNEIEDHGPFMSGTPTHARVCCGYQDNGFLTSYLRINDPWPVGHAYWEAFGEDTHRIYVRS
ncbi:MULTISPECIES: C39 family peptidase [Methanosarcina]|jgi:hypothetical protein|uniref:GTPase-sulfate adenylate transferase subunit 1 n=6 Tax=Methanosarcina mazei TaxID=2209 RepID=A0A0F8CQM0_METMZ|nr:MULTISPECIES: C39 family peptidase [Methanosarcina]AKB42173.1 GTPases - Sulfate adenylate transferase subunit 1 [Methanosarcina mazei WWM610]AKB63087.1 GTPases - Sulfate adenylate transferase subunit 1 [Methanosarcina mazei SarPi]AKB73147.1 GTPases - Sulfate adenylate transferase subunit 1 [Methanosarcina mazei C16]KKG03438.1 hypothetical protein DU40_10460 [Methanosarcina mazei]KKG06726.1 hypothetical protein DU47_09830 [Methanosarcina mazei]